MRAGARRVGLHEEVLFGVEVLHQLQALCGRYRDEVRAEVHEAPGLDVLQPLAEYLLVVRVVGVGDHHGDKGPHPRRFRPGRARLGQDRLGDFIEQIDLALSEQVARCA